MPSNKKKRNKRGKGGASAASVSNDTADTGIGPGASKEDQSQGKTSASTGASADTEAATPREQREEEEEEGGQINSQQQMQQQGPVGAAKFSPSTEQQGKEEEEREEEETHTHGHGDPSSTGLEETSAAVAAASTGQQTDEAQETTQAPDGTGEAEAAANNTVEHRSALPPSVSSTSVLPDDASDGSRDQFYRSLQAKAYRSNTEFAVAFQAALQKTEDVVNEYESERLRFGARQDQILVAYWRGWERFIHEAYETNDRILEFFWQRSLVDDKLANLIDSTGEPMRWDKYWIQEESSGSSETRDGASSSSATSSTYSARAKPVELEPPPDQVSSLYRATHMVSDVHKQLSRGLRRIAKQLRHDFFGVPEELEASISDGVEGTESNCGSSSSSKSQKKHLFLASRPWEEPKKFAPKKDRKKGKESKKGLLLTMRNEYRENVNHIMNKGDEISDLLLQVNRLCTDAYQQFRTSAHNLHVAIASAVSNGNEGSRASSDPELGRVQADSRSKATQSTYAEFAQKAAKVAGSIIGDDNTEVFLAFLRYSRCLRCLLQTKRSFMRQMSSMFEEFRQAEKKRAVALHEAFDRYLKWMDQHHGVLGVNCAGAKQAIQQIKTHEDFKEYIHRYVQNFIRDNMPQEVSDSSDPDIGEILQTEPSPIKSPLLVPLVYRWGRLERRTGSVMQRWEPVTAVLARTGVLYLFSETEDLATCSTLLSSQACPQPAPVFPEGGEGYATDPQDRSAVGESTNRIEELANDPALEQAKKAHTPPALLLYLSKAVSLKSQGRSSAKLILNFRPDVDKAAFEVGTVFSSMFVFSNTSKYLLRAKSNSAMLDWMYDIETVANRAADDCALAGSS
eukprot:gb/GECG01015349.1/.p1 GENE.gb/GECG01015349.1/~~gb/GECG01015349.1/.p1  ORF type:complete len:853 (+),score=140.21 gb/GECG01015349.1/:1-2559(+)